MLPLPTFLPGGMKMYTTDYKHRDTLTVCRFYHNSFIFSYAWSRFLLSAFFKVPIIRP